MTDLARARALVKELLEVLGEEKEPKTLLDTLYEQDDNDPARSIVRRVYSDGTEKRTSLPKVTRGGMEGEAS